MRRTSPRSRSDAVNKKISAGKLQRAVTEKAKAEGIAVARAMKWVAATALFQLCRIAIAQNRIDGYCVKGGFAVELRLPQYARTSEDIDLIIHGAADPVALLAAVISQPWNDFEFRIKREPEQRDHCVRVELQARFNNNDWCTLKLDLLSDPIYSAEEVEAPDLICFGLPEADGVPCLSRPEQIAQWIHSVTKPEIDGKRLNRARNIVDLFLFNEHTPIDDVAVLDAVLTIFNRELTHQWPPPVDIPERWLATLEEMIVELELPISSAELLSYFKDISTESPSPPGRNNPSRSRRRRDKALVSAPKQVSARSRLRTCGEPPDAGVR